jgi:hypothetical protein
MRWDWPEPVGSEAKWQLPQQHRMSSLLNGKMYIRGKNGNIASMVVGLEEGL